MKRILVLFVAFLLACVCAAVEGQPKPRAVRVEPRVLPTAKMIRTPVLMKDIGKQVTIKGFYYDGSIPMVIDNISRVYMDMRIPAEAYVPIVGPRPPGLKWGDRVESRVFFGRRFRATLRRFNGNRRLSASRVLETSRW